MTLLAALSSPCQHPGRQQNLDQATHSLTQRSYELWHGELYLRKIKALKTFNLGCMPPNFGTL